MKVKQRPNRREIDEETATRIIKVGEEIAKQNTIDMRASKNGPI